jgi:hypothetical protein
VRVCLAHPYAPHHHLVHIRSDFAFLVDLRLRGGFIQQLDLSHPLQVPRSSALLRLWHACQSLTNNLDLSKVALHTNRKVPDEWNGRESNLNRRPNHARITALLCARCHCPAANHHHAWSFVKILASILSHLSCCRRTGRSNHRILGRQNGLSDGHGPEERRRTHQVHQRVPHSYPHRQILRLGKAIPCKHIQIA